MMALVLSSLGVAIGTESSAEASPGADALPARAADRIAPSAARLPAPAPPVSAPLPLPAATDAAGAQERIRAAYEYGDIDEVVASAREVAEGHLHPSPAQRAYALRYLGIGLFLTGRTEGAEAAFFELLRLHPDSFLDPRTTRPDAVAFFEQVRSRHEQPIQDAARANNRKVFAWNFLPPAGQFQNGHRARAFTIGGLEVVSLGTAITTLALLKHWQHPDLTFDNPNLAHATLVLNYVSVGALAATALFGIIDGIAHYSDVADDTPPVGTTRLSIGPGGFSLDF